MKRELLTLRQIMRLSYNSCENLDVPTDGPTLGANVAMWRCGCGQGVAAFCFTMKTNVELKFNSLIFSLNL